MIACKCKYCDKWTSLSDIVKAGHDVISGKQLYNEVWSCEPCDVAFHYYEDDLAMTVFHTTIREQKYMWMCMHSNNISIIASVLKTIQSFDFIPELTPQTVKTKIKTYLTFL